MVCLALVIYFHLHFPISYLSPTSLNVARSCPVLSLPTGWYGIINSFYVSSNSALVFIVLIPFSFKSVFVNTLWKGLLNPLFCVASSLWFTLRSKTSQNIEKVSKSWLLTLTTTFWLQFLFQLLWPSITASSCVIYTDYKLLYQGLSFSWTVLAHCGCSIKRRWWWGFNKFSTFRDFILAFDRSFFLVLH